jgi:hypothetical protein
VPSASPLVDDLDATCRLLHFGPVGGGPIFDSFDALVAALAAVDAQELFFEVKPVFACIVGAMERSGRHNEVTWDGLLVQALRRRATNKTVAFIDRPPLDELLAALSALKDTNSDFARYAEDFGSMSLHGHALVNTVTSPAAVPCLSAGGGLLENDYMRDFELQVYRVSADRPPRMCKQGLHLVPISFDYCGECAEFFDDVYFCKTCQTPTSKSLAMKYMCRGRFSFVPCDIDGTFLAMRKESKDRVWAVQDSFRLLPSKEDFKNAAERHKRLEDRRHDRRGGLSAFTVAYDCDDSEVRAFVAITGAAPSAAPTRPTPPWAMPGAPNSAGPVPACAHAPGTPSSAPPAPAPTPLVQTGRQGAANDDTPTAAATSPRPVYASSGGGVG